MKNFAGRVAAITGAGSGIGRGLALELAKSGAHLALSDVNVEGLQETVDQLSGTDVRVTSTVVDVADREAVFAWADQVVADHGQVNLIFNNAGVALGSTVAKASIEDYEWIMGINFWGVIYGTKAFLPHLEASGEGHVVNISSVFGLFSQPTQSGYNASKFAVRGFTESLRQELDMAKNGVSATCVHPGGIKTNIARSARTNSSVSAISGLPKEKSYKQIEKGFITSPDKAARIILNAVRKDKRRVLVGPDARVMDWMARGLPTGYQSLIGTYLKAATK